MYTSEEKSLVYRAKRSAIWFHRNQKYGKLPYIVHLEDTAQVIRDYYGESDVKLEILAYAHDVKEDIGLDELSLKRMYGPVLMHYIDMLSMQKMGTRKKRLRLYYPQLESCPYIIPVKLADRISNVRRSIKSKDHWVNMYRKEHQEFKERLINVNTTPTVQKMWADLDVLIAS